ncbi:MAG: 30S ribosomal protein S18, partial [Deltaproteobacteria bacterium]|nr:30S ribosomal protein S18 [Deltaproteobacteria bacterium]
MAERNERPRRNDRGADGAKRGFQKKKVCRYCKTKGLTIDYKDAKALRPYIT